MNLILDPEEQYLPLNIVKYLKAEVSKSIEELANEILSTVTKELQKMTPEDLDDNRPVIYLFMFKYSEMKAVNNGFVRMLNKINDHIKTKLHKSCLKHGKTSHLLAFNLNKIYADPNVRKAYINAATN